MEKSRSLAWKGNLKPRGLVSKRTIFRSQSPRKRSPAAAETLLRQTALSGGVLKATCERKPAQFRAGRKGSRYGHIPVGNKNGGTFMAKLQEQPSLLGEGNA